MRLIPTIETFINTHVSEVEEFTVDPRGSDKEFLFTKIKEDEQTFYTMTYRSGWELSIECFGDDEKLPIDYKITIRDLDGETLTFGFDWVAEKESFLRSIKSFTVEGNTMQEEATALEQATTVHDLEGLELNTDTTYIASVIHWLKGFNA